MQCCQGNPAPFIVPDLQCSPSFLLTSQLPSLSYIWHPFPFFNRKAGRNIHALIHANISVSYYSLLLFANFPELNTLRNLQWQKKKKRERKNWGAVSEQTTSLSTLLFKEDPGIPHVEQCDPFFSYWCAAVILNLCSSVSLSTFCEAILWPSTGWSMIIVMEVFRQNSVQAELSHM